MAWRGAIAVTKGFQVRKLAEEKKEEKVKKWATTYKKHHELFKRQDSEWVG